MPASVWVAYPGVELPALVPRDAWASLWGPKGWQVVPLDLADASAALGTSVTDVAQLPAGYVAELLARQRATPPAVEPAPDPEPPLPARRAGVKKEAE